MDLKKLFHVEEDNVAVPEIRPEDFDKLQKEEDEKENKELGEQEIVYDNVAIPEIHIKRKKK